MEEVSRNEGITTQRELASSLNISLGLVNAFIKRIVRKGYFKVTTIPGRRVRYLFTPKGLAEKSRLTAEYFRYSLAYYGEIRHRMNGLAVELEEKGVKKVALIGTGELAELFCLSMQESGIGISQVISINNDKHEFLGYSVEAMADLRADSFDVVCVMALDGNEQMLDQIEKLGIPESKIFVGPTL